MLFWRGPKGASRLPKGRSITTTVSDRPLKSSKIATRFVHPSKIHSAICKYLPPYVFTFLYNSLSINGSVQKFSKLSQHSALLKLNFFNCNKVFHEKVCLFRDTGRDFWPIDFKFGGELSALLLTIVPSIPNVEKPNVRTRIHELKISLAKVHSFYSAKLIPCLFVLGGF